MIIRVEESNKEQLWDFIKNRSADLFYFIHNYQNNFDQSKFWIASDNQQPNGIILFDGQTLRISGPSMVVDEFLESIDFTPEYISVPGAATDIALKHIESSNRTLDMIRLTMKRQNFGDLNDEGFVTIKKEELSKALGVFQSASPEDWESVEESSLLYDNMNRWYGLRIDESLTSICWNQFYHHGGHVAFIATHPDSQNKGHATRLLKLVLTENFRESDFAIIHVRVQNEPAYHCYKKIGYQEHCRYTIFCKPTLRA